MFALKKILGTWLMPLPLAISLLLGALLLRALGYRRGARVVCWVALGTATLATTGLVGNGLLWPLESRHRAVVDVSTLKTPPRYIVVLGSGYRPRDNLPITSALEPGALTRIVEGVRLWRQIPEATLVLSGGGYGRLAPAALGYRKAALELGVPETSLVLIDDALDTATEIQRLRQLVADDSVLLVTSASHMPRALAYCERRAIRSVGAPTGHQSEPFSASRLIGSLLPSGVHLRKTETALHEYLGLLALQLSLN